MKFMLVTSLLALTSLASAHKVTTKFPDGATALTPDDLRRAVEDREFTAKPAEGPSWHLSYRKSGEFAVRAGDFADEGKWVANESAVCTEGRKLKYLCNEFRTKDGKLFLQRKGGEVMQLMPK